MWVTVEIMDWTFVVYYYIIKLQYMMATDEGNDQHNLVIDYNSKAMTYTVALMWDEHM